jgi:hypothetical protein
VDVQLNINLEIFPVRFIACNDRMTPVSTLAVSPLLVQVKTQSSRCEMNGTCSLRALLTKLLRVFVLYRRCNG